MKKKEYNRKSHNYFKWIKKIIVFINFYKTTLNTNKKKQNSKKKKENMIITENMVTNL